MRADLIALLPELVLTTLGMVVLLAGLASSKRRHGALGTGAVLALAATGVALWLAAGATDPAARLFFGMFALDHFAVFFKGLFLIASGLTILLSLDYLKRNDYRPG